jgi:hypothetical protein
VAERGDAEPLEIGFGQLEEHLGVDIVLAERLLILP